MQRDGDMTGDDTVSIVLDTYGDRRTGYFFRLYPTLGVVHSGIGGRSVDSNGNVTFTVTVYGQNGQSAAGNKLAPGGWIEMQFTFKVKPDGTVQIVEGSAKKYPSISIYSYSSSGAVSDIFQQTESGNDNDLNKPRSALGTPKRSAEEQEEMNRQCQLGNPAACDF